MGTHGVSVTELQEGTRPIGVSSPSTIGLVGTAPDGLGLELGDTTIVRTPRDIVDLELGDEGTLPAALRGIFLQTRAAVIVHRVAEGDDETETASNIAGDVTAGTGLWALAQASSTVGQVPKIVCVPSYSRLPVVYSQMTALADRLRAVVIIDGPSTTDADVINMADGVSDQKGRAYIIDPQVISGGVPVAASPFVAGVIARTDQEYGWWWSPSNKVINGVEGLVRPIGFALGDPSSQAQALNDGKVATIIRQDGWRLWGNRSAGGGPIDGFLSVRRTADVVAESVKAAHLWAVDRGITFNLVESIVESVNGFLRSLKAQGAIIDGEAWADPDLNTASTIAQGELYIDYKFTAVYPAESIQFRQRLTTEYLDQIVGGQ